MDVYTGKPLISLVNTNISFPAQHLGFVVLSEDKNVAELAISTVSCLNRESVNSQQ